MPSMLLDNEGRPESHGPGRVVEIGRGCHHRLVDLGKLLLGAVTLDAHLVAQIIVASRHGRIDAEKAAEVDLAFRLDREVFERDAADCALRHIPHHNAGVERCYQVLLRIGKPVGAAEFVGLVDVDREAARHLVAANAKALDFRAAARLALPRRGDTPLGLAFSRIVPDTLDQGEQVVDIDAVDDLWCGGYRVAIHDYSPLFCSVIETACDRLSAAWRAPPECADRG